MGSSFKTPDFTGRSDDQQTCGEGLSRARINPVVTLKLYARTLQKILAWKWIHPFQLLVKILNPRFRFEIIASITCRNKSRVIKSAKIK
jgi:hypothetical protein